MRITIPFKPHKAQWEVMTDNHRFKVVVAGRRCGKTTLAWNLLLYYALTINNAKLWYVAPTFRMAKEIVWGEMKRTIPREIIANTNETSLTIEFINGSIIKLNGVDNPDSLRGSGLHGVVLDEYQEFDKNIFPLVIRPALSDYRGFAIFIGTPKGKGGALYEEFIKDSEFNDKEYRDENGEPITPNGEYKSFKFTTYDNPYISIEEIEAAKELLNEDHFRQEYEADFVSYTGLIYKQFSERIHCVEMTKEDIVKANIYIGIDTGEFTAVEFCAYCLDGKWRIFDEIYAVDALVEDVCKRIKDKLVDWNINIEKATFIIDSASQHKREYMKNGIYVIDSQKGVLDQINNAQTLFKNNKILINKSCINLISEIKSYQWDNRRYKKKGRQPKKEHDHAIDAGLHYAIGSAYAVKPTEYSILDEEDRKKIIDKYGFLSDEYELWEDQHGIVYAGNEIVESDDILVDPITGY